MLGALDEVLDGVVDHRDAVVESKRLGQRRDRGVIGGARRGEGVLAHAGREHLRRRGLEDLRCGPGVQHEALERVQVGQREEHVPVAEHKAAELERRLPGGAPRGEREGDAVASIVGDHRARSRARDLAEVVLDQQSVATERVALALRLVGEAVTPESPAADPVVSAERLGDVVPVDAARREAVQQEQRGSVRIAELGMEDLELAGRRPALPTRRSSPRPAIPWRAR